MTTRTLYGMIAGLVLLLVISGFAFMRYEGTTGPFLMFDVSYLLVILLAVPKPRLYVYTFLSIFLFLGFWMKFMVHTIIVYDFVEPIGRFDGSGDSWDKALLVAAVAAFGVVAVRGTHLVYTRYVSTQPVDSTDVGGTPLWYAQFSKPVWIATLFSVLALNGWNVVAGFYQTGVSAKVILPLHLNIVAAWLINLGFALWIAALVYWESELRRGVSGRVLLAPFIEALVATISQLSRGIFLFHTVPYLLVLVERRLRIRTLSTKKMAGVLSSLFILGFVFSLAMVSLLRLQIYPVSVAADPPSATPPDVPSVVAADAPSATPPPPHAPGVAVDQGTTSPDVPKQTTETFNTVDSDTRRVLITSTAKQVLGLAVDRWVGLGGVLAVSAYPELGYDLLAVGIREDPGLGESSLYQRISGANDIYAESEQFTFLTLPGSVAVLYYSGSLYVVAFGMAAITLILMSVELIFSRLIGNPVLSSVSGLAMANVVCQLNFPYLAGVFLAQLLVTLLFIWVLQTAPTLRMLQTTLTSTRKRSLP